MFQKAGLRLKQMITQYRDDSLEDLDIGSKFDMDSPKPVSWMRNQVSHGKTNSSVASINGRKYSEVSTAYSSEGSLCSCGSGIAPTMYLSLSPARIMPNGPESLYLPPRPIWSAIEGTRAWQPIFMKELVSSNTDYIYSDIEAPAACPTSSVGPAIFDWKETIAIDSQDKAKVESAGIGASRSSKMNRQSCITDNVEMLIREADQAFQAVGDELEDAKSAAGDWYDISSAKSSAQAITLPRSISQRQQNSFLLSKPAITRTRSGVKTRKAIFQRRRPKLVTKTMPKHNSNTTEFHHTRWTDVTNNMVDAISGKIFRTEVDEILSPGKLEKLRYEVRAKAASVELENTIDEGEITPIEPFHCESLSSRVSSAVSRNSTSPVSPITPDSSPPPEIPPKNAARAARKILHSPIFENKMMFEDMNFPSPPLKSMGRPTYMAQISLPTIHEQKKIIPSRTHAKAPNLTQPLLPREPKSSQLVLPSTPYTLTSPLFRHGPIVINRARAKEYARADESLDWTAFQMAISGTANENYSYNAEEVERRFDDAELDDIAEWWTEFGFGLGELVHEEPKPRKRRKIGRSKERQQYILQNNADGWGPRTGDLVERKDMDVTPRGQVGEISRIGASVRSVAPWDIF